MEVDNCDMNSDGGHSMDEQDELSTPDDKLFFNEGPCTDGEKDDETLRAIRWRSVRNKTDGDWKWKLETFRWNAGFILNLTANFMILLF